MAVKEAATPAFLPGLAAGPPDEILDLFKGEPVVEDPLAGRIVGRAAVRDYIASQRRWMSDHDVAFEPIRTTVGAGRSVTETLLHLNVNGQRTELPYAVVGVEPDGELREVRIYHSNWPLEGRHRLRPPIIPEDPNLDLPDVVAAYMKALDSADLAGSLSVFEPTGYFREPSGGVNLFEGTEGIRQVYEAFYKVGGIHLRHCSVIDDGVACGVEFIADGWGPRKFEPQAGIGIYERGASGKLAAARIYDDVDVDLGLR